MKEYEVNKNTCAIQKAHEGLVIEDAKSNHYYEAVAVKTAITNILSGSPVTDELKLFAQNYESLNFAYEKTKAAHREKAWEYVTRYVKSEDRIKQLSDYNKTGKNPIAIIPVEGMNVHVFGYELELNPVVIFQTPGKIEVTEIKYSTSSWSEADARNLREGFYSALPDKYKLRTLYAKLKLAKDLAPAGQTTYCEGSLYYLKKKYDYALKNRGDSIADDEFFNGGKDGNILRIVLKVTKDTAGNIISEENPYTPLAKKFPGDCYYSQFEEEFLKYETGEVECSEEECANCILGSSCKNYHRAPVALNIPKNEKSLTDKTLSDSQNEIIMFDGSGREKVMRTIARAGSGKTTCLCGNIAMLAAKGEDMSKVLAITFSESATKEVSERASLYAADFGVDASLTKVITFNGFGNEQVIENYDKLGFAAPPQLLADTDRFALIIKLINAHPIAGLDDYNWDTSGFTTTGTLMTLSKSFDIIKRQRLSIGDGEILQREGGFSSKAVDLTVNPNAYEEIIALYSLFEEQLVLNNLIEYADQETLLLQLIEDDFDFLERLGYEHILIDEGQDLSDIQFEITKRLVNTKCFKSLLFVGDDNQSIYGFRGTNVKYIVELFDLLGIPEEQRIDMPLKENYRCSGNVVKFANSIIANNSYRARGSEMVATRPDGEPVTVKGFYYQKEEDEYIINEMESLVASGKKPEDIALIGCDRYELMRYGSMLTEKGIPWVMLNPELLVENAKVQGAIALAKAFSDPTATKGIFDYLNCLHDGYILEKTDEEIMEMTNNLLEEIKKIKLLPGKVGLTEFKNLLLDIDDEDEVYEQFLNKIAYKHSLDQAIETIIDFSIYGTKETYRRLRDYPGVVLTTNFSSKGLEWDTVFISLSKFDKKGLSYGQKEERNRIFFVAATRAVNKLYVTGVYKVNQREKKNPEYNKFLEEAFTATGQKWNPVNQNEEMERKLKEAAALNAAKERRKKAVAKLSGEAPTETISELCAKAAAAIAGTADATKYGDD